MAREDLVSTTLVAFAERDDRSTDGKHAPRAFRVRRPPALEPPFDDERGTHGRPSRVITDTATSIASSQSPSQHRGFSAPSKPTPAATVADPADTSNATSTA